MPEPAYSSGSGRTLVAAGYGTSIQVWRRRLVVVDGTGPDRRDRTFEAATFDYTRLIVAADHGQVTLDAIRWLTDQGACLVHVDRAGRVLAVAGDFAGDRPSLRRAQALATASPRGLEVARRLIGERARGQLRVAVEQLEDEQAGQRLGDLLESIGQARSLDGLRHLEAQAASRYWQSWAEVPVRFAGPGSQSRVPEHWRTFGSRHSPLSSSPRLAVTPANALLNYLMALLEAESRIACMVVGLDPGLGIVHADRAWRDSMACDVMEAVRADVESWLLRALSERTFTLRDFAETRRGQVRLAPPLASWVASTADAWGGHVNPIATWAASMLADEPVAVRSPVRGFQRGHARLPSLPPRCRGCFRFLDGGTWCATCEPGRTCRRCGVSLSGRYADAAHCSERCRNAASYAARRGTVTDGRSCAVCGTSLEGRRSHARYCSGACRNAARSSRRRQGSSVSSSCQVCGGSLAGRRPQARYCSSSCKGKATYRRRAQPTRK